MTRKRIKKLNKTELFSILSDEDVVNFIHEYKNNNKISSAEESSFLANIMQFFKPLAFKLENGKKIITGEFCGYSIKFLLQRKIYNEKTKRYFSLDLLLQLKDEEDDFLICQIALEYDGDDRHLIQDGVIKDKERDLYVFSNMHVETLRFDTSMLSNKGKITDIGKALKKYFSYRLKLVSENYNYVNNKILSKNERQIKSTSLLKSPRKFVKCLLCEGVGILGIKHCILCGGVGSIKHESSIVLDDNIFTDGYDCPECQTSNKLSPNQNCKVCMGLGTISRESAIEYQVKKQKTS